MLITRRKFINLSIATGSTFILGLNNNLAIALKEHGNTDKRLNSTLFRTPFITISDTNEIVFTAPVPEIGQGVRTSLSLLLAEELNIDIHKVKVEQGIASAELGGMTAAGSDSVADYYALLREAGAAVRQMLTQAASQHLNVSGDKITIENGFAYSTDSKMVEWGKLVPILITMEIPIQSKPKERHSTSFIGKNTKGVDVKDIINGKAEYGIDVRMEKMKFAAIIRPPIYGGNISSFNAEEAKKLVGVHDILELEPIDSRDPYARVLGGVAVIADSTWTTFNAKNLVNIEWDIEENPSDPHELKPTVNLREVKKEDISDTKSLKATYELPYMAHMCMEPMNFTANITTEAATLIGPTQRPRMVQEVVSKMFNIPLSKVVVKTTLAGGGFGRRLAIDYALEAAMLSFKVKAPVKLMWTREDDVTHDYFRTRAVHYFEIQYDRKSIKSWIHNIFTDPIANGPIYEVQGAADLPLNIPNINISWGPLPSVLRIGSWRSVAHSHCGYAVNSWIDEIARTLKKDPIELIEELMDFNESKISVALPLRGSRGNVTTDLKRLKRVINRVAELSEWQKKLPSQMGKGIAFTIFKNAYCAHVSKVKVVSNKVTVVEVCAVLDCGLVIHPDGVRAQIEGSILDGITTVFHNVITHTNGRVDQKNFNNLNWTRMKHCPQIKIDLIEGSDLPRGAGEPPYPSVAPSITNAIYDATGTRLYKLPASNYKLSLE